LENRFRLFGEEVFLPLSSQIVLEQPESLPIYVVRLHKSEACIFSFFSIHLYIKSLSATNVPSALPPSPRNIPLSEAQKGVLFFND